MGKNVIISTLPNISQNYLPKVNTSNIFANSLVYDDGSSVLINTTTASAFKLDVNGTARTGALTLTGALSGTSATFSGNLTTNSGVNYFNGTTDSVTYYQIGGTTGGHVYLTSTKLELSAYSTRNMVFETNGVTRLTISSTGAATFSGDARFNSTGNYMEFTTNVLTSLNNDGAHIRSVISTEANPTYTWKGDTNTGIYTPSADAIAITTGGSTRLTISSTGAASFSSSVTAGAVIQTPSWTSGGSLKLSGTSGQTGARWWAVANDISSYGDFSIMQSAANSDASYNQRLYISSGGNVGIGTTSPNNLIDIGTPITNALYGFSMSYGGTAVGVYQVNNATGELKFGGAAAGYFPTFYAGGSERMRITSGGNVVIGDATYGSSLGQLRIINNAASSPASVSLFGFNNVADNTTYAKIDFAMQSSGAGGNILATVNGVSSGTDENSSHLAFSTATTGTLSERMRITSGGNIGIGNSTFTDGRFYVKTASAVSYNSAAYNGTNANIRLETGGTAATGITTGISMGIGGAAEAYIGAVQNSSTYADIIFQTYAGSYGERMRITSGGTLQVAYSSATARGQISASAGNDLKIESINGANFLYDAVGGYHVWFTSGSEAMRIKTGGELLIGTTTDAGAYLLQVSGRASFRMTNDPAAETICVSSTTSGSAQYGIFVQGDAGNYTVRAMRFFDSGVGQAVVGNITIGTTSTAYNTTSDYRLKEDLKDYNGLELISKIKTYDFKWKNYDDRMYGVIAHELQDILPYAVTGVKDDVNEMQSADYSKLTPILIKAIQELKVENDQQKADIESLKALINK